MRFRVPAWVFLIALGFGAIGATGPIGMAGEARAASSYAVSPSVLPVTVLAAASSSEVADHSADHADHADHADAAGHAAGHGDHAGGHGDAHAGGHGKEEPSLFATEPWPYVWNLLMFLVLLVVLMKFVWPGILKGLQDRENKISGDLASAEKARVDAETKFAEYEAKLAEARGEAGRIVDEARVTADQVAAKIKAESERELSQMRERATAEIETAKTQAVSDIYAQAATLSTQLASQILGREINADDQRELIDRSLSELRSTLGSDGPSNN